MTDLQTRFVAEYLVDGNATQAYQRAGYKAQGHAATVNANRLLTNAEVAEAVAAGQKALARKTETTAAFIRRRLRIEAMRRGDGSSHSARVSALTELARIDGLHKDAQPLTPGVQVNIYLPSKDNASATSDSATGGAGAIPS